MKKSLLFASALLLVSSQAFATYIVILRNGTTYKAKSKWTVRDGKALVTLETGQTLQIDPALIDEAKSEAATRAGLGGAQAIARPDEPAPTSTQQQEPALGSQFKLRRPPGNAAPSVLAPAGSAATATAAAGSRLSTEVVDKFDRAYENVGLFEKKVESTGPATLRVELTADSEDKVFNAISATSFLMVRNAGVTGTQIDLVELFMKTTTGGSAGRFQMSRADAEALDGKKISQQEYYVRKVIY